MDKGGVNRPVDLRIYGSKIPGRGVLATHGFTPNVCFTPLIPGRSASADLIRTARSITTNENNLHIGTSPLSPRPYRPPTVSMVVKSRGGVGCLPHGFTPNVHFTPLIPGRSASADLIRTIRSITTNEKNSRSLCVFTVIPKGCTSSPLRSLHYHTDHRPMTMVCR
jgi:hypothetical protein